MLDHLIMVRRRSRCNVALSGDVVLAVRITILPAACTV